MDSFDTFRVFRQFHFEAICKKITQILGPQFEGGGGEKNFCWPPISPQILESGEFFGPLDI